MVSGAEREPGAITTCRSPSRTSVSAMTLHQREFVLRKSRVGGGHRYRSLNAIAGLLASFLVTPLFRSLVAVGRSRFASGGV